MAGGGPVLGAEQVPGTILQLEGGGVPRPILGSPRCWDTTPLASSRHLCLFSLFSLS